VRALKLDEIQEGTINGVDVEGQHVVIVRIGQDVYALSGFCTHEETDLANGFLVEDRIICPLHLSQFDCKTGSVLNPPAVKPLNVFNVKIEDGWVLVEV
jgi:nitrite reductase/ring-hydroxylating ferredoxin subunit